MAEQNIIFSEAKNIMTMVTSLSTVVLGYMAYKKNNKIRQLEEKNEYLKKTVHKISSKVDPESDRQLIVNSVRNIQIMGINSLGPLHHCREELICKKFPGQCFRRNESATAPTTSSPTFP